MSTKKDNERHTSHVNALKIPQTCIKKLFSIEKELRMVKEGEATRNNDAII